MVTTAAGQAHDEAGFFARLRGDGVLVRLRFSDLDPGQVTGYAVGLPGHDGGDGSPLWYGGGRLAAGLTLPRLRRHWSAAAGGGAAGGGTERSGAFRFTAPERDAIFEHAARQAGAATEHIRRSARSDPAGAADAADTLHVAARALRNTELRRAADSYDRAARARYGVVPAGTREGNQLRQAARLMAMTGALTGDAMLVACVLAANLVALAIAVAELREAQQLAAQAAGARAAAEHPHACLRSLRVPQPAGPQARPAQGQAAAAHVAFGDFPASAQPDPPPRAGAAPPRPAPHRGPLPPRRAGPGR